MTFTSSAQDSLVVVIHTEGGVSGVGECDANPWMAKACIEAPGTHTMGHEELVLSADGTIPLPAKPGLGVEVDWDVVKRYTVA